MKLKSHDDLARKHKREWLAFARYNGAVLNKIKVNMKRGDWCTFVDNEANITMRTAQKWMRIHKGWGLLPTLNNMSIDEASEYITNHKG